MMIIEKVDFMSVIYFKRTGKDFTQLVGIEAGTGKIFDDSELYYFDDIPDLSAADSVEMIETLMKKAGWEKVN